MVHVISFKTTRFDVSKETPNPINPIAGESFLKWLREELEKTQYTSTEPDTEDWGWYITVDGSDASYLVGASADAEESTPIVDWIVQVHRYRSLKDKLFGRNKMALEDPLFSIIESIVRSDNRIEGVEIDKNA